MNLPTWIAASAPSFSRPSSSESRATLKATSRRTRMGSTFSISAKAVVSVADRRSFQPCSPSAIPTCAHTLRTVVGKHGSVVICLTTGPDPQRVLYARSDDPATQIEVLSGAPVAICTLAAECVEDDPKVRSCRPGSD